MIDEERAALMKPEIKKILFASDLTENARRAFAYALRIAECNAAAIVIFHVVEDMPGGAPGADDGFAG
jgi:nucleotide-binding universal stress UspA family protein